MHSNLPSYVTGASETQMLASSVQNIAHFRFLPSVNFAPPGPILALLRHADLP